MFAKRVLLLATLMTVVAGFSYEWSDDVPTITPIAATAKVKSGDPMTLDLFSNMAKAVMPAIVNISTSTLPKAGPQGRLRNDPMFEMLERLWGPGFQMPGPQQQSPAQALGSGFIIREDGLIITNNHVIAGADIINVQVGEDEENTFEATVIGRDEATDIALIKIDADRKFPKLKLGNSEQLEVGEWVAAFGNPFGHAHSMSKGIISAKGREIGELNQFPFIQTDASINPGNSGGPLVDTRGEVIGVNTAIDARAQGIGFAIPIDSVKSILKQLETKGRIARGYLGVGGYALENIRQEALASLGVDTNKGVLVTQLEPGAAAAAAGMQKYDVITQFNKQKIASMEDLVKAVGVTSPGDKATIEAFRNGKKRTFTATVGDRPSEGRPQPQQQPKSYSGQKAPYDLGFRISEITPEMQSEWGINPLVKDKPIIVSVERNSPAGRAGLRAGDLIVDVNKKPVSSPREVQKALKKGVNALLIVRGNGSPALITLEAE